MEPARRRDRVGLPALLLAALISTAITPAVLSAGLKPGVPAAPDCGGVTPATAARAALGGAGTRAGSARVQQQIARRGELTGRVLSVQLANGAAVNVNLPVESHVGKATGDLILYTRHTAAAGSEVRALNLASGCDVSLATPTEIVRSGVLDQAANFLYVHSVSRGSRADAGVVRFELATGRQTQVVAPLRPADDFGPIFGTGLHWSIDGAALAVQSCGFASCLTRFMDVATGKVKRLDAAGQGAFIGLTAGHLVTFAACAGLPCDVLGTDLATGAVTVLAVDAFAAELTPVGAGRALVSIQTSAGSLEVLQ